MEPDEIEDVDLAEIRASQTRKLTEQQERMVKSMLEDDEQRSKAPFTFKAMPRQQGKNAFPTIDQDAKLKVWLDEIGVDLDTSSDRMERRREARELMATIDHRYLGTTGDGGLDVSTEQWGNITTRTAERAAIFHYVKGMDGKVNTWHMVPDHRKEELISRMGQTLASVLDRKNSQPSVRSRVGKATARNFAAYSTMLQDEASNLLLSYRNTGTEVPKDVEHYVNRLQQLAAQFDRDAQLAEDNQW